MLPGWGWWMCWVRSLVCDVTLTRFEFLFFDKWKGECMVGVYPRYASLIDNTSFTGLGKELFSRSYLWWWSPLEVSLSSHDIRQLHYLLYRSTTMLSAHLLRITQTGFPFPFVLSHMLGTRLKLSHVPRKGLFISTSPLPCPILINWVVNYTAWRIWRYKAYFRIIQRSRSWHLFFKDCWCWNTCDIKKRVLGVGKMKDCFGGFVSYLSRLHQTGFGDLLCNNSSLEVLHFGEDSHCGGAWDRAWNMRNVYLYIRGIARQEVWMISWNNLFIGQSVDLMVNMAYWRMNNARFTTLDR